MGTTTAGESMRAIMEPLIHAGDEAKLILKMTGSGELTIYAAHLDGTRLEPTLIDKHVMGSSFAAPGQEWGVFFRFTKPGCWQLHAKRDSTEGDIWFIAGPARGSGVAGDLL